jgi:thiol-disulfide isomerase/thioredoxin
VAANNQDDLRVDVLKYVVEIDPDGQIGQIATGKLKLIDTMGKPPEIAGPTLDGNDIDISEFKGKVVLVDFWATWCGPCVGELPNVRRVYDKYHDQGFEVLAVSFDERRTSLEKFVADNGLPWPQIFFDEDGKRYWDNPLGKQYGIDGIPATFLVDRDGNLQKVGVRGEELEPAVVELLEGGDRSNQ